MPIIAGLGAALGNWGVARLLRQPAEFNATVRLAYLHNRADVVVSLAPVVAGVLVSFFGNVFDPIVAMLIGVWFLASTACEFFVSHEDLIWPEEIVCDH